MEDAESDFTWDLGKQALNIQKHGVDFYTASLVFEDPKRRMAFDDEHGAGERRVFCFGLVHGRILTVRFVYRDGKIRIFGAGYWRKGAKYYAEKNR